MRPASYPDPARTLNKMGTLYFGQGTLGVVEMVLKRIISYIDRQENMEGIVIAKDGTAAD
jgi:hypothetical protein